jgi:ABC-type glucose/galactose transport system permease subunit
LIATRARIVPPRSPKKIPPFIVTLGTMLIYRSLAEMLRYDGAASRPQWALRARLAERDPLLLVRRW